MSGRGSLFSFVALEARVPKRHPLRKIREIVNDALAALDGEFSRLHASEGRPSIAPEKLLRASLLQAFFSVRSERQLMEQPDFNLLFRWFVGLGVDDPVWDATVFTKNRDRLLDAEGAATFMGAVLAHREVKLLLSSDHFSVDGTLVEAWASLNVEILHRLRYRNSPLAHEPNRLDLELTTGTPTLHTPHPTSLSHPNQVSVKPAVVQSSLASRGAATAATARGSKRMTRC